MEAWDGFTLRVKKNKQGLDLNRNFPANWRQEFEQLGAGPYPDVGAGSARRRVVHRRPHEHHRRRRLPHVGRRAAASVRSPARRRDECGGPLALPPHRRQGHRAHRLSGHLGLRGVSLPSEAGDRRRVRLGLRPSRHVQLGGRDLEPDARSGHHELQVHRLVPRPSDRGRPQALSLERRRRWAGSRTLPGSRSTTRSSAASRSAAGTASTRSAIRRRRFSSARWRAFRSGCCGRR